MKLYLIRHAEAQQLSARNDFTDEKRPLTKEGRSRMERAAKGLLRMGVQPALIMTSPLIRAVETAEIVATRLGIEGRDIVRCDALSPGASVDALFEEIKRRGDQPTALIGHEPNLSIFVSSVLGSEATLPLDFKKGGACCLEVTETVPSIRGVLVWLLTLRQLRMLGKT